MLEWYESDIHQKLVNFKVAFTGAIAVADLVKTTLGPKGMDKILQPMGDRGDVQVTNDGATILKSLYVDNAAAKIIIEISKARLTNFFL